MYMITRIPIWAYIIVFLVVSPVWASERPLATDLAQDSIDITAGFNGADIVVFGVYDDQEPGKIAVTVKGPSKNMTVRRKEKIWGVWMNRKRIEFEDIPGFYAYALSEIVPTERKTPFHPEQLFYKTKDEESQGANYQHFVRALVRNKAEEGVFKLEPYKINNIQNGFFKAQFSLPPNVPTGTYSITTYYLRDGKVDMIHTTDLAVEQVGLSAAVNDFSKQQSLIYGILCVLAAMAIGWIANIIRSRLR